MMLKLFLFATIILAASGNVHLRLTADETASLGGADLLRDAAAHWRDYKARHRKTYATERDETDRFKTFSSNYKFVKEHNAKVHASNTGHRVHLNAMADFTPDEYRRLLGFRRNYGDSLAKPHSAMFLPPLSLGDLPDKIDWRDKGYVTPVKNQGMCGSCWSFSATGALEGQNKRKTGRLVSLSEQNLVDCSTSYGNHGCEGGLMDQAFQYIKDNGGIDKESTYPYEAKDDVCRFKKADVGAADAGFMDIDSGNETALMIAVATQGPVSIAIDASQRSFQLYKNDVYIEPKCSPENLDHGVLVVGYGTTDDGVDYWIVKNSWGPMWGEDGYIRMARNRANQCGVATAASYPLVN